MIDLYYFLDGRIVRYLFVHLYYLLSELFTVDFDVIFVANSEFSSEITRTSVRRG